MGLSLKGGATGLFQPLKIDVFQHKSISFHDTFIITRHIVGKIEWYLPEKVFFS